MDANTPDWIDEYLRWTDPDYADYGNSRTTASASTMSASEDFVAAYLEWMDTAPAAVPAAPQRPASAMPRAPAWAGIDIHKPEALHEAILLMALRTERDCVRMLRQALDAGGAKRDAADLVRDALRYAERLLDDAQSAWHALNALYRCDIPRSSVASQDEVELREWPHALESVIADVRALTGRVLALHTH